MMVDSGIIVIDRLAYLRGRSAVGVPKRPAAMNLSHEEVFRSYRGFDGCVWPDLPDEPLQIESGVAAWTQLAWAQKYMLGLPYSQECDLIAIAHNASNSSVPEHWSQLGIDIGYFESEWSHFSVILNEIVYGTNETMRTMTSELNRSLLLDSREQALKLVEMRKQLANKGVDVERGGSEIRLIYIYAHESHRTFQSRQ